MSKKKHELIPLLDYLRIHRVIRSVLDSAGATTDRACWFFSVAGAAILRYHYGKDAQPLAGAACLMVNEKGANVLCFATIDGREIHSSGDAFHAMVACGDHLIDFMSPIFNEHAISSGLEIIPPPKSFQRLIKSMTGSHNALRFDGDYFFDPNIELTEHLRNQIAQSQFQNDLIQACIAWYRRPPKPIPSALTVSDEKGEIQMVKLKDAAVEGGW